jgi:hypothetical protein
VSRFQPVIEKGIPLPPRKRSGGPNAKYELKRMAIGDSFLAPAVKVAGLYAYAKNNAMKVEMRWQDDSTVRVWRME